MPSKQVKILAAQLNQVDSTANVLKAKDTVKVKTEEPLSYKDVCIKETDLIDVNRSYSLGHIEKLFEDVRNIQNPKLTFSQVFKKQPKEEKVNSTNNIYVGQL